MSGRRAIGNGAMGAMYGVRVTACMGAMATIGGNRGGNKAHVAGSCMKVAGTVATTVAGTTVIEVATTALRVMPKRANADVVMMGRPCVGLLFFLGIPLG